MVYYACKYDSFMQPTVCGIYINHSSGLFWIRRQCMTVLLVGPPGKMVDKPSSPGRPHNEDG